MADETNELAAGAEDKSPAAAEDGRPSPRLGQVRRVIAGSGAVLLTAVAVTRASSGSALGIGVAGVSAVFAVAAAIAAVRGRGSRWYP